MNAGLFGGTTACPHAAVDAPEDLDEAIRRHVRLIYEKYDRNVSKAAVALNITRTTLRKWL